MQVSLRLPMRQVRHYVMKRKGTNLPKSMKIQMGAFFRLLVWTLEQHGNECIKTLQIVLNQFGTFIPITSVLDALTLAAIEQQCIKNEEKLCAAFIQRFRRLN